MKQLLLALFLCPIIHAHAQLTNESEVGIASANGNTRTQTYNIKQLNNYKWEQKTIGFRSRYLNAKANGVETARFFMAGVRFEQKTTDYISLFLGETFEKDKFANIDKRLITDAGAKYISLETERTKFFTELGYRYMQEDRLDDTSAFSSYARLYSEWEHKWNPGFSTRYWGEYLPNISEANDWQFNTEFSASAVMTSIFSLKTGVLLRYDHLPAPGVKYKTDTLFTTAIVAKF
jgi:putative salt-induced outer membrane protein